MSHPNPSTLSRHLPADQSLSAMLEHLAALLETSFSLSIEASPIAVGVILDDVGFDLCATVLDGSPDPTGTLVGFVAPAAFDIFGVAFVGRTRHLLTGHPGELSTVVHLRTRSGLAHQRLHLAGEDPYNTVPQGSAPALADGNLVGRVDDLVARALALPTAAPQTATADLWSRLWLDRLLGAALLGYLPHDWFGAAALHPAVGLIGPADVDDERWAVENLDELVAALHSASWEDLRHQAIDHQLPADLSLEAVHPAWHDAGSFSREVVRPFLAVEAALAELAEFLPTAPLSAIDAALHRWSC